METHPRGSPRCSRRIDEQSDEERSPYLVLDPRKVMSAVLIAKDSSVIAYVPTTAVNGAYSLIISNMYWVMLAFAILVDPTSLGHLGVRDHHLPGTPALVTVIESHVIVYNRSAPAVLKHFGLFCFTSTLPRNFAPLLLILWAQHQLLARQLSMLRLFYYR